MTIDCNDPAVLSDFYARLLGWEREFESADFVRMVSGTSNLGLVFQKNKDYVRPVWPEKPGGQQQMEHIDFYIESMDEMPAAVAYAIKCGATKVETQYSDDWTVMLDPEGHPFCIDLL